MAISVNINGHQCNICAIYENNNGTRREISQVYENDNGTRRTVFQGLDPLPCGTVILFLGRDNITPSQGVMLTTHLNRFPRARSTATSTNFGGSSTHNHGAVSDTTTYVNHQQATSEGGFGERVEDARHRHTLPSHTHPNSVSNSPRRTCFVPYAGLNVFPTGACFLAIRSNTPSGFNNITSTYENSYIEFRNSTTYNSGDVAIAHNHGQRSLTTSRFNFDEFATGEGGGRTYFDHSHSATHTGGTSTFMPLFANMKLFKCTSDIVLDDIPSGVGFFMLPGSQVPSGFSAYTQANNRLIRINSTITTGGSSTHTHSDSGTTSSVGNQAGADAGTSPQFYNSIASHTHSYFHVHPSANHMPRYTDMIVVMKD